MNLKEAFRFQNKLQNLIGTTEDILRNDSNVMLVVNTLLKSKVDKDVENESTRELPNFKLFDLENKVTKLVDFLVYLFDQRKENIWKRSVLSASASWERAWCAT